MASRSISFLVLAILLSVARALTGQNSTPVGTYSLDSAGSHRLPVMISRIISGEGTTLHSARLELLSAGRFRGEIAVSFTDSGTVTDTILVEGHWEVRGNSVQLIYKWSRPRWQGGPRVFESGYRSVGTIIKSGLRLSELAYFSQAFFGAPAPLYFGRVQ